MPDYAQARRNMVDCQLRTFDVNDRALLAAADEIPRERFVPERLRSLAYGDDALPVAAEGEAGARRLLAPMVLARLIQALAIEAGSRVLDVAGGTGYAAAVLSRLGARVVALEDDGALVSRAEAVLSGLALPHPVTLREGSLAEGAPADGPFDAILVNGALECRPDRLLGQLSDGGRLACVLVDGRTSRAVLFLRSGDAIGSRALFDASAPRLDAFRAEPAFAF